MIAQVMIQDEKYKEFIHNFLKKNKIEAVYSEDLSSFLSDSLRTRPSIFFLENDAEASKDILSLVIDIRTIFGLISTIIILGDKSDKKNIGNFLVNGADHFFTYPFDGALVEDFVSKRTTSEYCKGFRYRHIPNRSHSIKIDFQVDLKEINTRGIIIESNEVFKVGTIVDIPAMSLIPTIKQDIRLIATSFDLGEVCKYRINLNYYEVENSLKSEIVDYIRNG
jgi:hypothetical protein